MTNNDKYMDWLESEMQEAKYEMKEALSHLDHDRAQMKYITLLKTYNKAKELSL